MPVDSWLFLVLHCVHLIECVRYNPHAHYIHKYTHPLLRVCKAMHIPVSLNVQPVCKPVCFQTYSLHSFTLRHSNTHSHKHRVLFGIDHKSLERI